MVIVKKDILNELECPVCTEYMLPPIAMCVNGHSICSKCREKLFNCPTCRYPFSTARCLLTENMVRKIRFPCRYSERGCRKLFLPENIGPHTEECPCRPFKCPFSCLAKLSCSWVGNATSVRNHIRNTHNESITADKKKNYGIEYLQLGNCDEHSENKVWREAIFCIGETFFMYNKMLDHKMYFSLYHVGLRFKTANYRYRVSLYKNDRSGRVSACKTTTSLLNKKTFEVKDCVVFPEELWKKCIINSDRLLYKIQICRNT